MLFELAGKSTAIVEGTAGYREREPFLPPENIYEQSTDELIARATEFSLRKNTMVSALWSEYIASQNEIAQQKSSSIERTAPYRPPCPPWEKLSCRSFEAAQVLRLPTTASRRRTET